jgi:hypothetical protein
VGLFLTSLDLDRDTRVSRTEVSGGAAESFDASDANADSYLRPIEFEAWSRTRLGSEYSTPGRLQFDHDQDGRVSRREFAATFMKFNDGWMTLGMVRRLALNCWSRLAVQAWIRQPSGPRSKPSCVETCKPGSARCASVAGGACSAAWVEAAPCDSANSSLCSEATVHQTPLEKIMAVMSS